MEINHFFKECPDFKTMALVYPDETIAAKLLNFFAERGCCRLSIAECLKDDDSYLPMPSQMMARLDENIKKNDGTLVVGLDGYLALLDRDGENVFMAELNRRLDDNDLKAIYLLSGLNAPNLPPRYEESRQLVRFFGQMETILHLSVAVFPDSLLKSRECDGYRQLLERMGQFVPGGEIKASLPVGKEKPEGFGKRVSFYLHPEEIARFYYDFNAHLPEMVLRDLLLQLKDKDGMSPEAMLRDKFGQENINVSLALKRLLELANDKLWNAYAWLLRRSLPTDSYMARVLEEDISPETMLWHYATGAALKFAKTRPEYAGERANALKSCGCNFEPLLHEFIARTQNCRQALAFLNCNAMCEREEIIRRAAYENLAAGLPNEYRTLYPALDGYLSDFDSPASDYFKQYRIYKIRDMAPDDFIAQAENTEICEHLPNRDSLLARLNMQKDTGLLTVDAMGAEYLPLLFHLAGKHGLKVESCQLARSRLPTATRFNTLDWDETRRLPSIKKLDNIVHYGAVKNEQSTPQSNMAATLAFFETDLMDALAKALLSFAKVVVTADHGSSRLAVIANKSDRNLTLPWTGQPEDWRYVRAPQNSAKPAEFESAYFPESGETFWVVRGYKRLPKMGGKLYELHGGATPEEMLVPVVVFTKSGGTEIATDINNKAVMDIGDNLDGLI